MEDTEDRVKLVLIAAADVSIKWLLWKSSHDYKSLSMQCCEKSINFFDALEHLEDKMAALDEAVK